MSTLDDSVEKAALLAWMNHQREHAIGILEGLSDEDLRRPVLPSGWSCLGMIAHLAGLERFWFRAVVAGNPAAADVPDDEPADWRVPEDMPADAVFAIYRRAAQQTDAIITATPLASTPAWWPDFFGDWKLGSVRDIVLHTLAETAGHTGHLDAARELIDGRLWFVLEV
jgi:uncharacterized damage-inducible protein DinB